MDDSTTIAVRIIRDYVQEIEYHEYCSWIPSHLEQLAYKKIAAMKILNYLKNNESLSPTTIIENFRRKMDDYSCMNEFNSRMFSIQADTAKYILDEIIVYEERRRNQNGQNKIRKTNQ